VTNGETISRSRDKMLEGNVRLDERGNERRKCECHSLSAPSHLYIDKSIGVMSLPSRQQPCALCLHAQVNLFFKEEGEKNIEKDPVSLKNV